MCEQDKADPLYPEVDSLALAGYYTQHVAGMTRHRLYEKSDIAAQLAWRDQRHDRLCRRLVEAEKERDELREKYAEALAALNAAPALHPVGEVYGTQVYSILKPLPEGAYECG